MIRKIEQANHKKITELLEIIKDGIVSSLTDYSFLYNEQEQSILIKALDDIKKVFTIIKDGNISLEELQKVFGYEEILKPLIFKSWEFESSRGAEFIYWFKTDNYKSFENAISTTFSNDFTDSFCGANYGIAFDITIDGFLGACNKDAATMMQDEKFLSIYTIGKTNDHQVINSYNLATPTYHSKHNEIILDARFIKPKYVVFLGDDISEFGQSLAEIYHISVKKKKENINLEKGITK